VLADGALVERLATERLEAEAAAVRAEGWKWVAIELHPSYSSFGRVYPMAGEDGEATFAPEDIARAGGRITLSYDATVQVDRGLLDAEAVKAERTAARAAEPDEAVSAHLPDSVVLDLTAHRTAALRLELARNTKVALASVVHALGMRVFYKPVGASSCLGLSHTSEWLEPLIKTPQESSATEAITKMRQAW